MNVTTSSTLLKPRQEIWIVYIPKILNKTMRGNIIWKIEMGKEIVLIGSTPLEWKLYYSSRMKIGLFYKCLKDFFLGVFET